MATSRFFMVAALLTGARNDEVRIEWLLAEDKTGQQRLNLQHAQLDMGRAGRSPLFHGV